MCGGILTNQSKWWYYAMPVAAMTPVQYHKVAIIPEYLAMDDVRIEHCYNIRKLNGACYAMPIITTP